MDSASWPLGSLRQSFLNGTLTRLLDPDRVLRARIAEFVAAGDFGLASGAEPAGGYRRIWFSEEINSAEIAFEADVYLLTKAVAAKLKSPEITPTPRNGREAFFRERCRDRTNTRHVGTQSTSYSEVMALLTDKVEFVNIAVLWISFQREIGSGGTVKIRRATGLTKR